MFEDIPTEVIEARLAQDPTFRRLHDHHRKLNQRIDGAEHGTEGLSDEYLSELKRERLHAKEELIRQWEKIQAH